MSVLIATDYKKPTQHAKLVVVKYK